MSIELENFNHPPEKTEKEGPALQFTLKAEPEEPTQTAVDHKPTNPKDAISSKKLPIHLWPTTATALGSIGLLEGMMKYGRSNWRESGVRASVYFDAALRHFYDWFEGNDTDPDSGAPQLAHVLACLAIIVDAEATGSLVDDRMYNNGQYRKLLTDITPLVEVIRNRHRGTSPKHYTKLDSDNGN